MTTAEQKPPFASIEDTKEKLAGQDYVCDRRLATVVYLATRLGKPVLVEGPAGVGKTELAKALSRSLERPLIRLALAATRGNQIKAAAMLGLNRNTLRKKIRELELPVVRGLS